MNSVVMETSLPGLPPPHRGKVRDIYALDETLLIVATDRLSAFDVVLPTGIPGKGRILTELSQFWFERTADIVPNHLLSVQVDDFPPACRPHHTLLVGRSMLVRRARPLPVECIVRGYLAGSGWKEYQATASVCGIPLPKGLLESARLPEPIFTPSTKAERGEHDQNISFGECERLLGFDRARRVREVSLALYRRATDIAEPRGIIVADTKFEFGLDPAGELLLIDEIFTPDSSRFWPQAGYAPGRTIESFDKQYVRDYLERVGWDKRPPAPALPPEVVRQTRERYLEALRCLTRS
ncbi:MAG: phosphoribosylaminoimidazolesuccinocarboxamide synthase [Candidatus Methylomirabilales bacterium]